MMVKINFKKNYQMYPKLFRRLGNIILQGRQALTHLETVEVEGIP